MPRHEFNTTTRRTIAERAGYVCSNPDCTTLTIGPDTANPSKSTSTGIAAHICAAAPGGPRYDMAMSSRARSGISNAMWLCATCSHLVDKNGGADYPADVLRRWKKEHERLIKSHLESSKSVGLLAASDEKARAQSMVQFLDQRSALFAPMHQEYFPHVAESAKEIRTYLTALQATLHPHDALASAAAQINDAMRVYMSATSKPGTTREKEIELAVLRKSVSLCVSDLVDSYSLAPPRNIG